MWNLLPNKVKTFIIVGISISLFLLINQCFEVTFLRSISYTVTTITILAWLYGKYLWKYCYPQILKKKFCPDFNGEWDVTINSNFNGGTDVTFPITIEADFFGVKMRGATTVGQTHANYCRIIRNEDDSFGLEYMYKVYNDKQSKTDTSYYEGAARLRLLDIKEMKMEGVYWTNRCWQNEKNTAGTIKLIKHRD